ncbi:MAG: ABC transporter substrate-binding protein [Acidimicrobiales bacterium]
MRAPLRALGLAVALALVAAACRSSPGTGSAAADQPPPGVLRLGLETPGSLDPAQARSSSELLLAEELFDALTSFDPAGLAVRPGIASNWTSTPDQAHWDFTLRPDATFGNGRQITSGDVKYTFERIARKGSTSPALTQLELISGFKPFNVTGKAPTLAGITTPSPSVVHFDLDEPLAVFPAVVGNPSFGIVPRESAEAVPPSPAFATSPVGSGPWKLASRTDAELHLVPAPGTKASIKAVDVFLAKDAASAYADFLRGGVDFAEAPSDQVEPLPPGKGADAFRPYAAELFYGFNLDNPKFADQRFREAIVHAIDRDAIVRVVYGAAVIPTRSLVAQGIPGSQPDACAEVCRFDPAASRDLLKQAFADKPPPDISIDYDDDPTQEAVAEAMQANLKAVGINAALRPHAFGDYLQFALTGQQELFRLGWIGAYPAADAFLTPLYETGTSDNVTGFSSGPVDALLKAGRSEPDPAKRTAIYQQAEKVVMSQVPVVPIAQFQTHTVTAPRVHNLTLSVFGTFEASQVRLSG